MIVHAVGNGVVFGLAAVGVGQTTCIKHPHNELGISENEYWHFVRSTGVLLPAGHPFGWDSKVMVLLKRELHGEIGIEYGMND